MTGLFVKWNTTRTFFMFSHTESQFVKKDLRSTRIDGEGRWFCRQRLVTLNRLFASNRIKILKELLVEYKFHIFYCVLTRSVTDSCCFTISVCAVQYFPYLEKYKYRTRDFNEILANTVAVALKVVGDL